MDFPSKHWLTAIIFEHACKHNLENVVNNVFADQDLAPKLLHYCAGSAGTAEEKPRIKPVFFLIYLLKKLLSGLEHFDMGKKDKDSFWESNALLTIIELLESSYQQHNFISLKKYFTLVSELKLLDLMYHFQVDAEYPFLMQKLNQYFPRWHSSHRKSLEAEFKIKNPKVLDTVEASHSECRRQTLRLIVDKVYRKAYIEGPEYSNDLKKLLSESKACINEIILTLNSHAGASIIEKLVNGEEADAWNLDIGCELLLEYLQPNVSSENLLAFLREMEHNDQPSTVGLSSCLLPFDSMSETSEACPELDDDSSTEEETVKAQELRLENDDEMLNSYICVPPTHAADLEIPSSFTVTQKDL